MLRALGEAMASCSGFLPGGKLGFYFPIGAGNLFDLFEEFCDLWAGQVVQRQKQPFSRGVQVALGFWFRCFV